MRTRDFNSHPPPVTAWALLSSYWALLALNYEESGVGSDYESPGDPRTLSGPGSAGCETGALGKRFCVFCLSPLVVCTHSPPRPTPCFFPQVLGEFSIGQAWCCTRAEGDNPPNKMVRLTRGHSCKQAEDPTFPELGGMDGVGERERLGREALTQTRMEGRPPRRGLSWAWCSQPKQRQVAAMASHAHTFHSG